MDVKCKFCRKYLLDKQSVQLLTAHSKIKTNSMDGGCTVDDSESCSYISAEKMPLWIEQIVNKESWTKGRLHCEHCNNRIGSFNFVNDSKCSCGEFIVPPIQLINSKVDILFYDK